MNHCVNAPSSQHMRVAAACMSPKQTFSAGTLWSSYRDTQILLFTDLLLVAPLLRNSQPTYEASIGLSAAKLRVFRANAGDEGKVPHRLEVISPAVTYAFCFSAAQERDEWAIALATQLLSLENPDCSSQSNSRLEDWATESVKHAMDVHRVVMGTLHSAALRGDTSEVSSLLAAGAPSDALDSQGLSALDYAVRASQVGAVKLLLAAGSAIDCVDESGRNLLHIASMSLSEGVLKALLESPGAGPLVNSRDEAGFTPAHAATVSACNGDMRDVPELSMYESPPPLTGCLLALRCAGADLDFPAADGLSSLHRSAMLWRCGVVESLCACGADPDGALPDTSPLHLACSGSRRAAAASLMSSSSFQKLDDSGSTLQYSSNGSSGSDVAEKVTKSHSKQADYNLPGTVKALLQWGASPNLPDGAGVVPMEYLVGPWLAEEEGRREVTEGAGDTSPATPHAISGGIGASRIAAAIVLAK
jgi:ankyrin repeat protein